jgi:hypothetical protein
LTIVTERWVRIFLNSRTSGRPGILYILIVPVFGGATMLWKNFDHTLNEIELMRIHANRQRDQICQIQRVGMASAEALLARMLTRVEEMSAERRHFKNSQTQ